MSASRTKFYLDKKNAKWMGVCAGIADYTGVDVTWVRVGTVRDVRRTGGPPVLTLEIEASIPAGAPEHVVRTVTQNGRDLKFTSGGFESE